jgi:uncharacterized membrane protein
MSFRTRFRRHESALEGLWAMPVMAAVLGAVAGIVIAVPDDQLDARALRVYSPSTASAVLTSIVGASAALTGFVVTVTVLVVQMATGTFSARVLRLWYRDPLLKATLAVLVGTLTFSFSVLRQIDEDAVPDLGVTLAGLLVSVSILIFIVFFDRCIRQLRPVAVAADVARSAIATFEQTVRLASRTDIRWDDGSVRPDPTLPDPTLEVRAGHGGAVQGVDPDGLVNWARAHSAQLVLPHPVGDFVPTGTVLVRVYGGTFGDRAATELEEMIALGDERTFDQDPAFALRIMVDIANRALSPAVNDPTTAVQVLDHIGEVLGTIGMTELRSRADDADGASAVVVIAARRWEDFVTLALTEIREYGATSVQVVRRLRALLEDLLVTVRAEHRPALAEELRRLDAAVAETWRDSVDRDRASVADRQGIGGHR